MVDIHNPLNYGIGYLYVHMWVVSGIVDPTAATAQLNVDARFGRPTQPAPPGLTVNAQSTSSLNFALNIPAIEKATYFFYLCLLRRPTSRDLNILERIILGFEVA